MCLFRPWSTRLCFARHMPHWRRTGAVSVRGGAGRVISYKDSPAARGAYMHTTKNDSPIGCRPSNEGLSILPVQWIRWLSFRRRKDLQ
jgi:hypothetical protein